MTESSAFTLIPAGNPGPYTGQTGNNTWFVNGEVPTLIDAGTGERSHLDAVAASLGGRPLARLIVTHGHVDHASGVPAIRATWPDVQVMKFVLAGEGDWTPLRDGDEVPAGDLRLRVVYTPGHAADHICLWDEGSRDLVAGDMVVWPGSVLIPAGRGGSLRDYLLSLERMAALQPKRLLPGHGPIIEDPLAVIAQYQAHRQRREEQIAALLSEGITTVDALTERIYPNVAADLRRAASMTVQAHLEKLREDGRLD
jgi:glyoxylase-like metal-dependent hydrolase (beta-lactamase superfamily II)